MYVSQDKSEVNLINSPISEHIDDENKPIINFDSKKREDSSVEKISDTDKIQTKTEQLDIKAATSNANKVIIFYSNGTFQEYTKG